MLEPLIMLACIAAVFGVFMAAVVAEGVHKTRWNAQEALLALYARYRAGIEAMNAAFLAVSISTAAAAEALVRFGQAFAGSAADLDAALNRTDAELERMQDDALAALAGSDDEVQR